MMLFDHEQHDGVNLLARLGSASNEQSWVPAWEPALFVGVLVGLYGFDAVRWNAHGVGRAGDGVASTGGVVFGYAFGYAFGSD